MTVRLELEPEIEALLTSQAHDRGVPLDKHLQNLIEEFAHATARPETDTKGIRAALDRLAEMGKNLPHLPSSAFSRENIYLDHN